MLIQSEPVEEMILLNPDYLFVKRVFDVTLTILFLPFLCFILGIVALLIRLDSQGPILFRQRRVGQNDVPFDFLKFRSMYSHNDDSSHRAAIEQFINGEQLNTNTFTLDHYKLGNDPRITRVGKFLRKTSLDEFPQFINVLRGEMSLVGPRPPLLYEVELYSSHARSRLAGKPGLTGIWQVYGRSRVPFSDMIEMDLAYLRQQSLLLDLKLILLTLPVLLTGRGGA